MQIHNESQLIASTAENLNSLKSERSRLEHEVCTLKDSLKVKDSMLEDQNETIRNIKMNLENKVLTGS